MSKAQSRLKERAKRFYAEWDTNHGRWCIFDRHRQAPPRDASLIATAIGRHTAYRIRDALNKTEPSQ